FPAHEDLVFPDDWDVVFALTSDDTGVAADAGVEINCQRPLMTFVRVFGIEGGDWRTRCWGGRGFARRIVDTGDMEQIALLHPKMLLRTSERIFAARRFQLAQRAEPEGITSA